MKSAEHFDEFGGRQVLRVIFWLGLCVISGAMWGGIILLVLVVYAYLSSLMVVLP